MERLARRLRAAILKDCQCPSASRMVVGVSGGGDSVALLHALIRFEVARPEQLVVAHVNHGLRGSESESDEDFVIRTSTELGVACLVRRVDVRANKRARGESLEMAARRLRHAALSGICREVAVHRLCLAHTADDQVEHFMLRLLRGSGPAGLRGMAWTSPSPVDPEVQLLRPLLSTSRDELRAFLSHFGLGFREDSSNGDLTVPRNRIRHEVLPALRRVAGPAADRLIQRSMELLRAESEFVELAARQWEDSGSSMEFDSRHVAMKRIIIRDRMIACGLKPDFECIEQLRQPGLRGVDVTGGKHVTKRPNGVLEVSPGRSGLSEEYPPCPTLKVELLGTGGRLECPRGVQIVWREVRNVPPNLQNDGRECLFDAASLGPWVTFRQWRPGDRMRRLGMRGRTKLQDLFVNRKLPRGKRRDLWIGEDASGEIFWVEGIATSETHKVRGDSRRVIGILSHREDGVTHQGLTQDRFSDPVPARPPLAIETQPELPDTADAC